MSKSPEQVHIQQAMAHVRKLQDHGHAIAEEYEFNPVDTTTYVDPDHGSFDLQYRKRPTNEFFLDDKITRHMTNSVQRLFGGDATVGHSAQVEHSPLEGGIVSLSMKHEVVATYSVTGYRGEAIDPSFSIPDVDEDDEQRMTNLEVGALLDTVQSLRTDQLYIPEKKNISATLNEQLLVNGTRSINEIFWQQDIIINSKTTRTRVVFKVGQDNPIDVFVEYEPLILFSLDGDFALSPMAHMHATFVENEKAHHLLYDIKFNDVGYPAGVMAYATDLRSSSSRENNNITSAGTLKFLDEILGTIAQNASKGVLALKETYNNTPTEPASVLTESSQPSVELTDGIDIRNIIKALAEDYLA